MSHHFSPDRPHPWLGASASGSAEGRTTCTATGQAPTGAAAARPSVDASPGRACPQSRLSFLIDRNQKELQALLVWQQQEQETEDVGKHHVEQENAASGQQPGACGATVNSRLQSDAPEAHGLQEDLHPFVASQQQQQEQGEAPLQPQASQQQPGGQSSPQLPPPQQQQSDAQGERAGWLDQTRISPQPFAKGAPTTAASSPSAAARLLAALHQAGTAPRSPPWSVPPPPRFTEAVNGSEAGVAAARDAYAAEDAQRRQRQRVRQTEHGEEGGIDEAGALGPPPHSGTRRVRQPLFSPGRGAGSNGGSSAATAAGPPHGAGHRASRLGRVARDGGGEHAGVGFCSCGAVAGPSSDGGQAQTLSGMTSRASGGSGSTHAGAPPSKRRSADTGCLDLRPPRDRGMCERCGLQISSPAGARRVRGRFEFPVLPIPQQTAPAAVLPAPTGHPRPRRRSATGQALPAAAAGPQARAVATQTPSNRSTQTDGAAAAPGAPEQTPIGQGVTAGLPGAPVQPAPPPFYQQQHATPAGPAAAAAGAPRGLGFAAAGPAGGGAAPVVGAGALQPAAGLQPTPMVGGGAGQGHVVRSLFMGPATPAPMCAPAAPMLPGSRPDTAASTPLAPQAATLGAVVGAVAAAAALSVAAVFTASPAARTPLGPRAAATAVGAVTHASATPSHTPAFGYAPTGAPGLSPAVVEPMPWPHPRRRSPDRSHLSPMAAYGRFGTCSGDVGPPYNPRLEPEASPALPPMGRTGPAASPAVAPGGGSTQALQAVEDRTPLRPVTAPQPSAAAAAAGFLAVTSGPAAIPGHLLPPSAKAALNAHGPRVAGALPCAAPPSQRLPVGTTHPTSPSPLRQPQRRGGGEPRQPAAAAASPRHSPQSHLNHEASDQSSRRVRRTSRAARPQPEMLRRFLETPDDT